MQCTRNVCHASRFGRTECMMLRWCCGRFGLVLSLTSCLVLMKAANSAESKLECNNTIGSRWNFVAASTPSEAAISTLSSCSIIHPIDAAAHWDVWIYLFVCVATDIVALLRLEKCVDSVAVRASTLVFSTAIDSLDIRAFDLLFYRIDGWSTSWYFCHLNSLANHGLIIPKWQTWFGRYGS